MRAVPVPGLLAVLLTATACAGPNAPFDVGTQNAPCPATGVYCWPASSWT